MKVLSRPTVYAFGSQWSAVFFWLLILTGSIILFRSRFYTKALFKFAGILLFVVCTILSFQLIDIGVSTGLTAILQQNIIATGGYFWYLGILWADYLFGSAPDAIRWFYIAVLVWLVFWIATYYKIKMPAIKFENMKSTYEAKKSTRNTSKKGATSSSSTAKDDSSQAWFFGNLFSKKDTTDENEVDIPTSWSSTSSQSSSWSSNVWSYDKQTLKWLLKDKLHKSVQKKELDTQKAQQHINFPADKPTFPLTALTINKNTDIEIDEERLLSKAQGLKNKLAEFNIDVDIEWFNIWPTVIQIKIKPKAGVKVSQIENLKKDLALGIRTKSLRILAPIPWSANVWVEIPNPKPQLVRFHDVVSSVNFAQGMQEKLTNLTIWKGITGEYVIRSLESMPHLLVAGATGSGKSIWVNGFITSLIYQNTPAELKFIMVDPKQVELGIYDGIPYLLAPIITEPEKAVKVLKRSVDHMNERYKLLKDNKVRNIDEYNARQSDDKDKLYRIVIIIDELADLMMSGNKKDTENHIARIAQMARAVGMHLILATQRPSVNVITGLIKANIPTRIAFSVVSQIDSRTILDSKWAEDLVGKWDLLYSSPKNKHPIRIQSPLITTEETEEIISYIKEKYMSNLTQEDIYHPEIMRILEKKEWFHNAIEDVSIEDEALIEQAIDMISQTRKCSATMMQRKLWIGFPRAARIVDILEARGIVWAQEWARPREILI